jgi:ceramide glucosyltransferase
MTADWINPTPQAVLLWCGTTLAAAGAAYAVIAWWATRWAPRASHPTSAPLPPVTVLKPLCGAEDELYGCLRSLCDQHYPSFQIVCGVRDPEDPAIAVVRRLQRELPQVDLELVIDATQHGSSRKVSNLINQMRVARHDFLVLADSDVRVPAGYLAGVVAPLLDHSVGIVTCPYRGVPRKGLWSLLGSLFVNDWFMPSVYVAALFGSRAFAFGATIALRREALETIGGFQALADQLADDYRIGELTRQKGLRTVLSEVTVETFMDEPSLRELVLHELRWLRTIRAVRPAGYAAAFPTFYLPVTALGAALAGGSPAALTLLAVTVIARLMLHSAVCRPRLALTQLWALPLSDGLALALWCWGFATREVHWRQARYVIARDGSVHPIS